MKSDKPNLLNAVVRVALLCLILFLIFQPEARASFIIMEGMFSAKNTAYMIIWFIGSTLVCIIIEGLIYKYFDIFQKPFLTSITSNILISIFFTLLCLNSYRMGNGNVDMLLLALIIHSFAAAISIAFEYTFIRIIFERHIKTREDNKRKSIVLPVVGANLLTNIVISGYYLIGISGHALFYFK